MKLNKIILSILVLLSAVSLSAQGWAVSWQAETDILGGTGDYLPFWQRTGRNGILPYSSSTLLITGADLEYKAKNGLYFETGANLVGSLESGNPLRASRVSGIVDRLYVSGGWKMLHLDVGLKPRYQQLGDLAITGGNFVMSNNARNIPGINAWSDWIYFEKLHLFGFKGNIAHYHLDDTRYTEGAMIHNKSFAVKFGWKDIFELEAGLDHWAQWGGDSKLIGPQPSTFRDFLRIIVAGRGGDDATKSDQLNALGNHLGREYVRLNYNADFYSLSFQYDMPFDDAKNLIQTQTFPDGVWSLKWSLDRKNAIVADVIYEYIHTTWQSGDTHDRPATEEEMTKDYGKEVYWQDPDNYFYGRIVLGGRDNYFNNGEYASGWTYHGRTIGLPLILPVAPDKEGYTRGVANNRIRGHHLGIKGNFGEVPYVFKSTYTSNWGTYSTREGSPFYDKPWQLSLALELEFGKDITNLPLGFGVGAYADFGKLYQNSFGLTLRIRYCDFRKL